MDLQEAEKLARLLMDHHGLGKWKFKFEYDLSLFGYCYVRRKVICLSQPYVEYHTAGFVVEIVLHEIAHALAGEEAIHSSPEWVVLAEKFGTESNMVGNNKYVLPGRYQARCRWCHSLHHSHSARRGPWLCVCEHETLLKYHDVSRMRNPEARGFISEFIILNPPKKKRKGKGVK